MSFFGKKPNSQAPVEFAVPISIYSPQESPTSSANPFLIASSGGGGHIAAIKALLQKLNHLQICNPASHKPRAYDPDNQSLTARSIQAGAKLGPYIQSFANILDLPNIPSEELLNNAIQELITEQPRPYLDMLLDVYECGYPSAAIWNINQREGKTHELGKLVRLQHQNDEKNYQLALGYFKNALRDAFEAGKPYTEIISTQVMGLGALCDAVIDYNQSLLQNYPQSSPIVLHQYMTDLPTKGAVHFFEALASLTPLQRQQVNLYGIDLKSDVLNHFFKSQHSFKGVYAIPPEHNPMVRKGFTDPANNNSNRLDIDIEICFKRTVVETVFDDNDTLLTKESELTESSITKASTQSSNDLESYVMIDDVKTEVLTFESTASTINYNIAIPAQQKIASIMLGSQASNDSIEYIEPLLKSGVEKIFIFAGNNSEILKKIDPVHLDKIILLGPQDDNIITQLMTRSNTVIIRGGGLSIMEQLAMAHPLDQKTYIHHAYDKTAPDFMSSGISWEDENAALLIKLLAKSGLSVEKICPEFASVLMCPEEPEEISATTLRSS